MLSTKKQKLLALTDTSREHDPYHIGLARGWLAALDYIRDLAEKKVEQEERRMIQQQRLEDSV